MSEIISTADYKNFINEIKTKIQQSQIKAAVSVNVEMLKLYWFIGSGIVVKQKTANWGDGLLKQISRDLKAEFPNMKGFSDTNLKYMKQWYLFWSNVLQISQQPVDQLALSPNKKGQQVVSQLDAAENELIFQIPWGQNIVIVTKSKSEDEALFYVQKTIENNWSRNVLVHQIESELYKSMLPGIEEIERKIGGGDE